MNAYYVQIAEKIYPIYGVSSVEEAKEYVDPNDWNRIVSSSEDIYMLPETGSVDFESGWETLEGLVQVEYNPKTENWETI